MTYTVLSHVEERYEADSGKASIELKQIKDIKANQKEEQSKNKREERFQPSAVCGQRKHGCSSPWAAKLR